MKNFLVTLKTLIMSVIGWFNRWPKDLILHFTLADNINAIAWIIAALTVGLFATVEWVYAISAAITVGLMLIKDCVLDSKADWRDIAAGFIGLLCSQLKIWLLCLWWLATM